MAFEYHDKHGLPIVILSPSLILGPGDDRLSSTGDVRMFLKREIPNVPGGGLNFVDVRDAADAMIRAMEVGVPGRRYLIGGHNMTVKEFFGLLERLSGVRGPRLEMPESWSRTGAALLRGLYRIAGTKYPLDDTTVELAYRFWYLDNSRAKAELGLTPRPAEETLRDTIAYLRR
jgi:dihydroflavonol-4-reductase